MLSLVALARAIRRSLRSTHEDIRSPIVAGQSRSKPRKLYDPPGQSFLPLPRPNDDPEIALAKVRNVRLERDEATLQSNKCKATSRRSSAVQAGRVALVGPRGSGHPRSSEGSEAHEPRGRPSSKI
jgi:hypothetical protein